MPADALLLNADDLGLSPAVDAGIFAVWAQRAIGDSSIFATAEDLPAVLSRAREAALPVGIHLNLTFGHPLSDPAKIPALVTAAGAFMKRGQWTTPLPAGEVQHELRGQVQRVLSLGWTPSHLDSHHHIHAYPEILREVIALAREFNLPVRATTPAMRQALRDADLPCPTHFSMAFYGEDATVATLKRLVDACPGGVLEVMTHPGHADPSLPSSYREARANELTALTDRHWQAWLQARGIPVVGYGALKREQDDSMNMTEHGMK